MTGELLLELLTEEIPARMQLRAASNLAGLISQNLVAAQVPSSAALQTCVTPRRLVIVAEGIAPRQPDREEERRGPRVGAPEAAVAGFLRAAGLASLDQCELRATERGEFYFAIIRQQGRATAEVLPELIQAALAALPWPKSMRYPASPLRWVRPLNSVVCLFDGEVMPLSLGAVPVGRTTRGHRFLAPAEIAVANAADYRAKLAKAHVVLDWHERRDIIARDLDRLARAEGLTVKPDDGLLDEVAGLVECPVVLMGDIDADFVRPLPDGLPPEVLATAMRTHQKYFTCLRDGEPAPRFLFVANNRTADGGKTIAAGNERVLRARLADARFFWDQDRKIRLEDRVDALKGRVYHEKLGSVYDKVERMEMLALNLAQVVPGADPELCRRAARLAKADLSTGMVGEFPELQGVMGRYYALGDGEDPRVADAIAEHYKPLGPNDGVPAAPESIVVALADKIDALTRFFMAGERPTGSGDPFALRRAALGVIRIVLENKLRVALRARFNAAQLPGMADGQMADGQIADDLVGFVADRLKVHLREQGIRHDLIAAAFRQRDRVEDDLVRLIRRVAAIGDFLATDDGASLLTAYRRAANIVSIEERRDNRHYEPPDDPRLLSEPEENALTRSLGEISGLAEELIRQEKFSDAMAALTALRRPVDEFFDKVTVNVDDPRLRENRLRLLARIRATMNQIADFSQIEG
ncbi:MAG TPA: glycine--tRNA ligase subunit beta [Stellaceae bacterium]|nr:glycine--tRNA ligase subunit beta [Stellaceae bacterium]